MRLIDADAMAESLEHDVELDARAFDSMDLVGPERERVQFDKDCKQNCMWYLTEQPTIAASTWRRVEDEMPDLLQFVVVCNDEGRCVVAQYVGYQTDSLTPWRIAYTMYDTDIYDEKECGPVRYWMPIEPPKEGKDA